MLALAFYEQTTRIPHTADFALEGGSTRPGFDVNKLLYYACVCRVEPILSPYLDALL